MKLAFKELFKNKRLLAGAMILAVINTVFSLLDPQIFRLIIDRYATRINEISQAEFITGVGLLLLASVSVALISRIAKAFQDYYVNVMTQRVGTNIYAHGVSHAFSLPYAVFEDESSGELLNKLQKARTDTQQLIANSINIVFLSAVGTLFVLIYATIVHPLIGLVYFLIIPVLGISMFFLSRGIKDAQRLIVKETATMSGSTTETLRNVELVKSLGLENQEIDRLNNVNDQILSLELKKVKLVRSIDFIQGTLINGLRSALLLLMLWLIFKEAITIGEFFTLLFYSFAVFGPLTQLGAVAATYQEARASLAQLDEVLDKKPSTRSEAGKVLDSVKSIKYEDISLRYSGNGEEVLKDINLEIKPGETVAFVGPSGSGKSTMVKLLACLYQPTKGKVLFNDILGTEIDVDNLRRRIGLVAQETQLFSGTIRENLLFVRPEATDNECLEALKQAQAESILQREGLIGLNTKIGEGGVKLSGGERQRLAIARALLRRPDIIIFDEATSSLDSITEKAITETIKKVEKSRPDLITILVAHRLSTINYADKIYVFEKGKIVESGTHRDLIQNDNLYSALWREQSGNSS